MLRLNAVIWLGGDKPSLVYPSFLYWKLYS